MPWSAPLSRELLVFNSFVRSLTRALRTLLEVTSLNMLLRNDARQARDDFLDITLSLPFQTEVNTGFGILAKVYLDALTHINNGARVRDRAAPGVQVAKEMALDLCEETFPGVKSPKLEVERGFRFWDLVSFCYMKLLIDIKFLAFRLLLRWDICILRMRCWPSWLNNLKPPRFGLPPWDREKRVVMIFICRATGGVREMISLVSSMRKS